MIHGRFYDNFFRYRLRDDFISIYEPKTTQVTIKLMRWHYDPINHAHHANTMTLYSYRSYSPYANTTALWFYQITPTMLTQLPYDPTTRINLTHDINTVALRSYDRTQNNSGRVQGKFLEDCLVPRGDSHPDRPTYLAPGDFFVGARLSIFGTAFVVEEADGFVRGFMEENTHAWDPSVAAEMAKYYADKA